MRFRPGLAAALTATLVAAVGHAQVPASRDTTPVEIAELTVTVTRTPEPLSRVPQAVSVIDRQEISRGKATLGIDEALSDLPRLNKARRNVLITLEQAGQRRQHPQPRLLNTIATALL